MPLKVSQPAAAVTDRILELLPEISHGGALE